MPGLGIAAHDWQVCDGALRADIIDKLVDFSGEQFCAGQAEDVIRCPHTSPPAAPTRRLAGPRNDRSTALLGVVDVDR